MAQKTLNALSFMPLLLSVQEYIQKESERKSFVYCYYYSLTIDSQLDFMRLTADIFDIGVDGEEVQFHMIVNHFVTVLKVPVKMSNNKHDNFLPQYIHSCQVS